jgi:LAO/AO transport system kinase
VPGLGDEVQALKAGIMEIADVFVVNKADREGVERVVAEIESLLSLDPNPEEAPAIVRTVATRDEGVEELLEAVRAARRRAEASGALARKKRLRLARQLEDAVRARLLARVQRALPAEEQQALVERLARRELDPAAAAEEVVGRLWPS